MAKKKSESKKTKKSVPPASGADPVEVAKRAIDRVHSDLRVTPEVTLRNLVELSSYLEPMIDTLHEEAEIREMEKED